MKYRDGKEVALNDRVYMLGDEIEYGVVTSLTPFTVTYENEGNVTGVDSYDFLHYDSLSD